MIRPPPVVINYRRVNFVLTSTLTETSLTAISPSQADIKECHKKLVEQLTHQLTEAPGPPTRKLLARCLATLFSIGDTFLLFDTVNKCNDILRNKDDSPSYLATKL